MKQTIRLTESDLHRIVKESVNKVINESVSSTVADKLRQCSSNVDRVLNTIKNDVIDLIDSIKDGKSFGVYSKVMNNFRYSYPQMINNCYEPIIDEYVQSKTVVNKEDIDEPEDWYERNEHGDFDTY
jgi:hypothetical protein